MSLASLGASLCGRSQSQLLTPSTSLSFSREQREDQKKIRDKKREWQGGRRVVFALWENTVKRWGKGRAREPEPTLSCVLRWLHFWGIFINSSMVHSIVMTPIPYKPIYENTQLASDFLQQRFTSFHVGNVGEQPSNGLCSTLYIISSSTAFYFSFIILCPD